MSNEPQVTISMSEYNELIKIKDNFETAFNNAKSIVYHDSYNVGMGYFKKVYHIVTNEDLKQKIEEMQNDITFKLKGKECEIQQLKFMLETEKNKSLFKKIFG
jgi:hypothetical protein